VAVGHLIISRHALISSAQFNVALVEFADGMNLKMVKFEFMSVLKTFGGNLHKLSMHTTDGLNLLRGHFELRKAHPLELQSFLVHDWGKTHGNGAAEHKSSVEMLLTNQKKFA
jgi:hypothetical protein